MRLDKIEPLSGTERVKLRFSDGTAMRLPAMLVYDLGLKTGMELSEDRLRQIQEEAGYASSKQRAVRILAASVSSRKELARKLIQKGETRENTDRTIEWLDSMNLLDDEAAARQIAQREYARGYGPRKIRQVLAQKGIEKKLWDNAMEGLTDYQASVERYLSRHLSGTDPDTKEKKKLTDALLRRGFSWEQIRRGFQQYRIAPEEEFE